MFRLAFPYREELVEAVRTLPYASFDAETKTWTAVVARQSVEALRQWFLNGLTDVNVDSLVKADEAIQPVAPAVLRRGAGKKPFIVSLGLRNEQTYTRLRAVVGATWDKKMSALTYPASSAAALAELVARHVIADPDGVLSVDEGAVVLFDARSGTFTVKGGDDRAASAFAKHFPRVDVVNAWRERGLKVGFLDEFTEQMYAGELVREHPLPSPEGLLIDLYPHQQVNYSIAVSREGHAVFDEPGLGKSATAIAAGKYLLNEGRVQRVVIVVPAAVRSQWASEIERFTGDTDIAVVKGSTKERMHTYQHALDCRWAVVHYDVLARDTKELRPLFAGSLVVADEAHRVKSREAARTKALRELSKSSAVRLALTGTPVETSPEEWFEIISGWAMPGCLGSAYEFNERYRWKNRWGGFEGARNIPELRERSRPFYSRHTKNEVAKHLPPLRVQQLVLDPSPAYAAALRRAHADAVEEIKRAATERVVRNGSSGGVDELSLLDESAMEEAVQGAQMTAVGLLRLMCSSPRIVEDSDSESAKAMREAGLIPDDDGPKLDELRSMAAGLKATQERRKAGMAAQGIEVATEAMVTGERMVVFTFSKRMANLVAERFKEDGVPYVLFTGDVKSDERDSAVKAFTDPNSDVIAFISTDAGAEGLNLGRCCNLLVNVDLAWTASRMAQRAQRIHRLDGTAPRYLVVNLTVAGTIEAGILRLLESRADLTDALFGEEGGRASTTGRRGGGATLVAQAFKAYADEYPETNKSVAKKGPAGTSKAAEKIEELGEGGNADSIPVSESAPQEVASSQTPDGCEPPESPVQLSLMP